MTNAQLFLAIGIPTLAILLGMLVNFMQVNTINLRISDTNTRISDTNARLASFEASVNSRFDVLMSKIVDIDNRLVRLEE